MKTVFILGAGASAQAGAPLMSNFLDCAHDLYRLRTPGIQDAREDFSAVFDALVDLQGVHAKAYLDLDNIEIVFGAIEMGLLLRSLGGRTPEEIASLRDSLVTLIYRTLEYSIKYQVQGQRIMPPEPYGEFFQMLRRIDEGAPQQDPHSYSFLTFNYDTCLDFAMNYAGRRFSYCIDGNVPNGFSPLLKLHGSVNWGTAGDDIVPFPVQEARFDLMFDPEFVHFNLGSMLHTRQHNGQRVEGPPVIVPPTWNKNSYHGQLSNVWAVAANELAAAENIFVIGYSLPETDSFFRYLYALGSQGQARLRNFVVVNPDGTGDTEARFKGLVGRGVENRFRYIQQPFQGGIVAIEAVLQSP